VEAKLLVLLVVIVLLGGVAVKRNGSYLLDNPIHTNSYPNKTEVPSPLHSHTVEVSLRPVAASAYDEKYRQGYLFQYSPALYRRFVKGIIRKAGLQRGAHVLDVGCGQGFFSGLFADLGFQVVGADFSQEGIRTARAEYATDNVRFEVGNGLCLPYQGEFDAVFVRAWSPYNVPRLEGTKVVTNTLLSYLKPSGVLIFAYPSHQCPLRKSHTWIHHSLSDTRKCFSRYPSSKVYFSIRAFTLPSFLAVLLSKVTGIGGELVALVWKGDSDRG
jgi:SAM-dependent methyltransferase